MAFSNKIGSQPAHSGNTHSEGAFPGKDFFIPMLTSLVRTNKIIIGKDKSRTAPSEMISINCEASIA